jgi:hypothetical protein
VAVKKAKGKRQGAAGGRAAKTRAGKSTSATRKQRQDPEERKNPEQEKNPEQNIVKVRGKIDNMVKSSAEKIANKLIQAAEETAQLASAKYLFEAVGLYPAVKETAGKAQGDPLAEALLRRLGMSIEPGQPAPTSDTKGAAGEAELAEEMPQSPPRKSESTMTSPEGSREDAVE